ncbi:sugar ABC transporter ATP-binding protein [Raineyella sp. LH-20]|uniref:sugar ABC transporter ATP-binding protein n=1 Tax=Raineyella sp. LH-20 TaxID=3081204 RepID=UPI002955730F|nr:sugar ABC transporter ATP-binding protein [Raineyella sp. LH-20]WOP19250.1 sugar ABC transporter ATP-binding protein [Raineyella sp. LH-20]
MTAARRSDDAVLEVEDITKSFGGIPVLKGISMALDRGTVTALAGENGAGKSTLMKIIAGQYAPDAGRARVAGQDLPFGDIIAAQKLGVAIVPQELTAIPEMKVYENLAVGREITRAGFLDRRALKRRASEQLATFGIDIDPELPMHRLPVGLQQIVEIVKNVDRGATVLLLDEPTSAIADREREHLYELVDRLRTRGVAMIYTTHKMEEIHAIADRVIVLRDGVLTADTPVAETTEQSIVTAMVGRELTSVFPPRPEPADDTVLTLRDWQVTGASAPVDLDVRRGEILGLAGLMGAGRTELLESIFGLRPIDGGTLTIKGRTVAAPTPDRMIRNGVAMVPEDRKGSGLLLELPISTNGALPNLRKMSAAGFVRPGRIRSLVGDAMDRVRLKSAGLHQPVGALSGGNQQKVVLGRWLTDTVDLLLLDEPTRGVDVGARSEIYRIIVELARQGMAVIMASSDMPEVMGLAHRTLVMQQGAVRGELGRDVLDSGDAQETIFRLATGLESNNV